MSKQAVTDIFGDSDSDDEDDAGAEQAELFNLSDDDEDEEPAAKKPKKLGGGRLKKKAAAPAPAPKEKKKKQQKEKPTREKRSVTVNEEGRKVDEDGNAYDSGDEVEATAEDTNFIDNDDDDDELLAEYSKEKQRFDEDVDDDQFEDRDADRPMATNDTAAAAAKKDADNPIQKTVDSMKRQRRKEMSSDEKDRVVQKLLEKMNRAHEDDRASIEKGVPALAKLELLPVVLRVLKQRALHASLLEQDALIEVQAWLEPDAGGSLPALQLRTALLEALQTIQANTEALKRSRLGVLIMKYTRDKREIPKNQRLAKSLVELWSRPIVGKETDYRVLESADERVSQGSVRGRIARVDHDSDNLQEIVKEVETFRAANPDDVPRNRVAVPRFKGFDFHIRPNASVDGVATKSRTTKQAPSAAKGGVDTARARLQRKLKKR